MNLEVVPAEFSENGHPIAWRIQPVNYWGLPKRARYKARAALKKQYGDFIFNERPTL